MNPKHKPRVFVTRQLPGSALDRLKLAEADVEVWAGKDPPPRDVLLQMAANSHGLLTMLTETVDRELLSSAPYLLAVSNMATGFDNIDVAAASENRVLITRTAGVLTETTADLSFALLLAAARRLPEANRYVREGRWGAWDPQSFLGRDAHGATLGIIGLGNIGLAVARRARGFGMRVVYYNRAPKPREERRLRLQRLPLDDLLRQADFISLHIALTPETYHLIGQREFDLMKPTSILVNTARGAIIDSEALYAALQNNRITAAAIDVTDPEPLPPQHPLISLPNLLITPHIGSASQATRTRMAELAADNLMQALSGRLPKETVNREIAPEWRQARRQRLRLVDTRAPQ